MNGRSVVKNLLSLALAIAIAVLPAAADAAPKHNQAPDSVDAAEPDLASTLDAVGEDHGSAGDQPLPGDELNALNPEDMAERSSAAIGEMREALRTAAAMLADARRQRDLVLISCVNDRIKQIGNVLSLAEEAHKRLQGQSTSGDVDGARASFTKLMLGRAKVATLRTQCQSCVGVESYFYGDTQVQTEVNPELAGGDPFFRDNEGPEDMRVMVTREFDEGVENINAPPFSSTYR